MDVRRECVFQLKFGAGKVWCRCHLPYCSCFDLYIYCVVPLTGNLEMYVILPWLRGDIIGLCEFVVSLFHLWCAHPYGEGWAICAFFLFGIACSVHLVPLPLRDVIGMYVLRSPLSMQTAQCEQSGVNNRTRAVRQEAECGGKPCGPRFEETLCTGPCCPVNCQLTEWSTWSSCNTQCGLANQTRSR